MNRSLVRQAAAAYRDGDYSRALHLYCQLSSLIGPELFQTNILLTKKKLMQFSNSGKLPAESNSKKQETVFLHCNSGDEYVEIGNKKICCEIRIAETDFVIVSYHVKFEKITTNLNKKSFVTIEYIDAAGNKINGPYIGLTKSDSVGWFIYLEPSEFGESKFMLRPPKGSVFVRLEFRAHYVKLPQRVFLARNIKLRWHDNNPSEEIRSNNNSISPTLPVLSFEMPAPREKTRLTIASVLDNFSQACFDPECNLIPITPSHWREELINHRVDMVLVESAWHGNDDAWIYRIAKYQDAPGNELSDLLRWARKYGVPTVFWNKEDPPNFDRFIDKAVDFDYIFTTDENCIERYRSRVSASTYVGSLPFAAQPRIHNPRLDQPRISATSFAGTYYADDYAPRRRSVEMLLRIAAKYGLDIFDRMHGVTGKDKVRFTFPADLQQHIRGSLAYKDMLEAYRRYRTGLNVNSVSDSPTMFSRRVFELLACGTPVVSTESLGVDKIFSGLVPTVETDSEALQVFNALMFDPLHWLKTSVRGLRAVFKDHTYAHRLQKVAEVVGLRMPGESISAPIVIVQPRGDASHFAATMQQQILRPAIVIVAGPRDADENTQLHVNSLRSTGLAVDAIPSSNLTTYLRHRYPDATVAICDSRHYYGPGYLLDSVISLQGASKGSASTILPENEPVRDSGQISFDSVANIGMLCQRCNNSTLVVRQNYELLMQVFEDGKNEDVVIVRASSLRTRAGFDFASRRTLDAGYAATRNNLS